MNSIIYMDLNNNNLGDSLDGGKVYNSILFPFYAFRILGLLQGILSLGYLKWNINDLILSFIFNHENRIQTCLDMSYQMKKYFID